MFAIKETPQGIVFKVYVQPRASKNMIVGVHEDALKIKITAPPIKGKANKMCLEFLAECLEVPKTNLEIISGANNRNKQVLLCYKHYRAATAERQRLCQMVEALLDF